MMTADLGACEWFLWDLRRSNLLDRSQLDQTVGGFLEKNPRAEPPALAEFLVSQGLLTQFQADRLLQGKTQGFVLGPYVLMDALGTGSLGTVYRAKSKTDSQWYAVKVLPRRSMWNVRIAKRKVRLFEQCRHPSVVPFVDVGTSGGMHYLAWPMVEGETLDKVVQRQGKLEPREVARLAIQTAQGLDVCHRQSLVHGLLKPSNLMLGSDGQVHILDFGIGSLLAETEGESLVDTMSTANSVASGLDCASPESIMDPTNLTTAGDQYSLGCTMYYFLTGQYPFPEGTAAEKMIAQQTKQPTPLSQLAPEAPPELVAVVERLMQKAPEARYGSIGEVVDALKGLSSDSSRPAAQPAARRPAPRSASDTWRTAVGPGDTPQPIRRTEAVAPRPQPPQPPLPSRSSLRNPTPPAPRTPVAEENGEFVHPAPMPSATPIPAPSAFREPIMEPQPGWKEKAAPYVMVVLALGVCGVTWLMTWGLF